MSAVSQNERNTYTTNYKRQRPEHVYHALIRPNLTRTHTVEKESMPWWKDQSSFDGVWTSPVVPTQTRGRDRTWRKPAKTSHGCRPKTNTNKKTPQKTSEYMTAHRYSTEKRWYLKVKVSTYVALYSVPSALCVTDRAGFQPRPQPKSTLKDFGLQPYVRSPCLRF